MFGSYPILYSINHNDILRLLRNPELNQKDILQDIIIHINRINRWIPTITNSLYLQMMSHVCNVYETEISKAANTQALSYNDSLIRISYFVAIINLREILSKYLNTGDTYALQLIRIKNILTAHVEMMRGFLSTLKTIDTSSQVVSVATQS